MAQLMKTMPRSRQDAGPPFNSPVYQFESSTPHRVQVQHDAQHAGMQLGARVKVLLGSWMQPGA